MSSRREHRSSRTSLLDGLEEGRFIASSSFPHDISERDNDEALDNLQDRVSFLKRLTGDIHEEAETHNRMLDRMGNNMDSARGIMSGTINRFKMVFEKKSNRRMCKLVAYFVGLFLIMYYLIRLLRYIKG
ncbi:PREDICTED: bet1-like SNARE 1-2 isoform X2 [Tarenaya hassleriana]|uniref:bet1-like SNARE 1-2 isoform X2 n=1 Tax=Tarenaya hassleriana TaxID=28532 RepID=UPI00053C1CB5|nr:PREDICTED: bet1-like SNARE 1-2 isoform X2 [Tarenaya hassleriana]XP_010527387.1 PREDICTED: bet1-like SNARE 1-2 isoform X2 [Tarenaya hassleriana]